MKAWFCFALAVLCGLLGLLLIPDSVREIGRLFRLSRGGVRVFAQITRIEEESVSTSDDSTDRARYGPYKIVEEATVRYVVADREYQARHRLPEPIHTLHLGDRIPLLVLAEEPSRSYLPGDLPGNWMMAFMIPVILLLAAATFGGTGVLLRDISRGRPGRAR